MHSFYFFFVLGGVDLIAGLELNGDLDGVVTRPDMCKMPGKAYSAERGAAVMREMDKLFPSKCSTY